MTEDPCSVLANLFAFTPAFKLKPNSKTLYDMFVFNSQTFMAVGDHVSQALFVIEARAGHLKRV